jgi:aerobic carbon-monoxide dehydrogenase medium subunit
MRLLRPQTMAEALHLVDESGEESKVIAGGTALMLMMRNGLADPDELIALDRIPELAYLDAGRDVVRIGALTTLRRLQRAPELNRVLPTLAASLGLVANHRVRQRATIGGNLSEADYASDPPAVLTTLGCRVRIMSRSSERVLPLPEFLLDFYETALAGNEIVTEVLVPRPPSTARTTYLKYVSRSAEDRPCVGVAAYLELDESGRCREVRIAVSGATATPFTLADVTRSFQGAPADSRVWNEIAEAFSKAISPISDGRGSAAYRKHVIGQLVRRALEKVAAGGENGAEWL